MLNNINKTRTSSMELKDRLYILLELEGLNPNQFYLKTGLGNGFLNSVGDTLRKPSIEKIHNSFPNWNIEWLLTGKGEMIRNDRNVYSTGKIRGSVITGDNNSYHSELNTSNIVEKYKELEIKFEACQKEIEHYKKEIIHLERLLDERQTIIDLLKKNN